MSSRVAEKLKIKGLWFKEAMRNYSVSPRTIAKNIVWRYPRTKSNGNYVFIVGAPRSGTTLMQAILNGHSSTFGFDYETSMFTYQNIFDVNRYLRVLHESDVNALFRSSKDIIDFFDQFVNKLTNGKDVLVIEKTPHHVTRLRFILKYFPNAKVIHLYRDGRDSYCSARSYKGIKRARNLETYAKYWRKCIRARQNVGKDDSIIDVKYEEFTAEPEKILRRILAFIGLGYQSNLLNTNSYGGYFRAQNANFAKLSKRINTSSHGRWKTELLPLEVVKFEDIAGSELRNMGYPLSSTIAVSGIEGSN